MMKSFVFLTSGALLGGLLLMMTGCSGAGVSGAYIYPYDRYERYHFYNRYPFGRSYRNPYRLYPHPDYRYRYPPGFRYDRDRFRYKRDRYFGRPPGHPPGRKPLRRPHGWPPPRR
ncbi:MAG: hypothetical protein SCH71_14495 [Desulfobulbaceae bacterium]|nr:hypothetical protein [Desulfobulbaceae bacterium]